MVELPPAVEELNEFGKFVFLNEMHTMASQIMVYVKGDERLSKQVKLAIDAIEGERKHLRDEFTDGYIRPDSKNVVALIMRCAELYLQTGIWYDLSRANIRLADKTDQGDLLDDIKECFASPDLTERYVISSPIIELTLTRIEMIKFFENEQYENYKGPPIYEQDPLSQFKLPYSDSDDEVDRFNNTKLDKNYADLDNLVCDDNDYLEARENMSWSILRDIRVVGSIATIIYYLIFLGVAIYYLTESIIPIPYTLCACAGASGMMLIIEIASLRSCLAGCCMPDKDIDCIYPGLDLYVVEYIAAWIASIVMILLFVLEIDDYQLAIGIIIAHHTFSLIWPLITQCFFSKKNWRVGRKFKWPRVGFFASCWWGFYRVISFIFFTPSISGIQTILYSMLKNSPSVTKMKEQAQIIAL